MRGSGPDLARRRAAGGVLAASLALAGCADDGGATDGPAAEPAAEPTTGLTAEVTQFRQDAPQQLMQVRFVNGGDAAVRVEALHLELPGFTTLPDVARSTRLPPGAVVDVPVKHGEPDCAADPTAPGGVVVVQAAADGSPAREVRVPVSGDVQSAVRAHARICARERLDRAAVVRLSDDWPEGRDDRGRPALLPTLVLERRPGSTERVVVQDAGGHVLFTVAAADGRTAPLLVLEPGQDRVELPLRVVTTRCDPHALTESKRTPLLLFYIGVGDDEPRSVPVQAPTAVHAALSEFATRSCRG